MPRHDLLPGRRQAKHGILMPRGGPEDCSDFGQSLVYGFGSGFGWALAGLCPGPALASLSYGGVQGLIFLLAMIAGMLIWRGFDRALPHGGRTA